MRDIVFRGKSIETGEWVTGWLIKGVCYLDGSPIVAIVPDGGIFYPRCEISEWIDVDPNTVGQYTGLSDENGVGIYEGDIIDASCEDWDCAGPASHSGPIIRVEYDKGTGGFNPFANYDCDCGMFINASGCAILGNKWDDSELWEIACE